MRPRVTIRPPDDQRSSDDGTRAERRKDVPLGVRVRYALAIVVATVSCYGAWKALNDSGRLSSAFSHQKTLVSANASTAKQAKHAAHEAEEGLARYKTLSAERRAQNKRTLSQLKHQTEATHSLALQIGQLADQRAADSAQAITAQAQLSEELKTQVAAVAADQASLSRAEAKIRSLQASQHQAALEAEYNTCIQVEALRRSIVVSLDLAFPPGKLPASQEKGLQRILAQFKAEVCVKP